MSTDLLDVLDGVSTNEIVNDLATARKSNPFEEISRVLIEGGADLLYFRIKDTRSTQSNLYKKWVEEIRNRVGIESSRKHCSSTYGNFEGMNTVFHLTTEYIRQILTNNGDDLPILLNPYALLKPIAKRMLSSGKASILRRIGIKITNAERFPLLASVHTSASKKERTKNLLVFDFRKSESTLEDEVCWNFDFAFVIPMEYSWIASLLSQKYDLRNVALYCDKPKKPNHSLTHKEFISAWFKLFGVYEYNVELKFPKTENPSRLFEFSEKKAREAGISFQRENKEYAYIYRGDIPPGSRTYRVSISSSHIRLGGVTEPDPYSDPFEILLNQKEKPLLDMRVYGVFQNLVAFLRDEGITLNSGYDVTRELWKGRDKYYKSHGNAGLLLHQM